MRCYLGRAMDWHHMIDILHLCPNGCTPRVTDRRAPQGPDVTNTQGPKRLPYCNTSPAPTRYVCMYVCMYVLHVICTQAFLNAQPFGQYLQWTRRRLQWRVATRGPPPWPATSRRRHPRAAGPTPGGGEFGHKKSIKAMVKHSSGNAVALYIYMHVCMRIHIYICI